MKRFKKVLGVVVCVAVLLAVLAPAAVANEVVFPTLVLAGSATITTVPDIASVTFSIRTFDSDPIASQEQNREHSNEIYAELNEIGIGLRDTRTQNYTLRRIYDNVRVDFQVRVYNDYGYHIGYRTEFRTDRIFRGYETLHSVLVTITDVDYDENLALVGKVVDLSISHGATQFGGVSFSLSDAQRARVYTEALEEAARRINERARTMMSMLGIYNIRPVTVNIENVRVNVTQPPTAPGGGAGGSANMAPNAPTEMLDAAGAGSANASAQSQVNVTPSPVFTPISPGETTVTASVSVMFTY